MNVVLKRRVKNFSEDFDHQFNGARLFDAEKFIDDIIAAGGPETYAKMQERHDFIGDGNAVVVEVLKRIVTGLVGYPITPSTPIAEGMAKAYADGFSNVFGEKIFYFQPESELGAMAFLEGAASQGGRFADNTSSQGLTYKIKNMYSVAGKRLPVLMTVQTRELNKGSLSIHNGHGDLYAARGAGWIQLMSCNNQELHHLVPLTFKAIEQRQVMLPAIVAGEGFLKSHSIENIKTVSDEFLKHYLGEPNRFYQPDFDHPVLMGTFTDIGVTMPVQMKQDQALLNSKKYIQAAMNIMNVILGTDLQVVERYHADTAEYVVVCMGSVAETMKEAIDYYRSKGIAVGLVRPVLFYPVCSEEIAAGVQNARVISVLEKVAEGNEQYLLKDVKEAVYLLNDRQDCHCHPRITAGTYGLGNQDISLDDCCAVIENMLSDHPQTKFKCGIRGPQTLAPVVKEDLVEKEVGVTFIGIGAEGVKTAQETLAKIIAKSGKYVQTSAKYGASRKGGMVVMNARVSDSHIRNCSNVTKVETLSIFNDKYLQDNCLLHFILGIKKGGHLIINTVKDFDELLAKTTPEIQQSLEKASFNVVLLDATSAALEKLKRNLPGTPILGVINKITGLLPEKQFKEAFKAELSAKFGTKKPEMIDVNLELLDVAYSIRSRTDSGLPNAGASKKKVAAKEVGVKDLPGFFTPHVAGYTEDDEYATPIFPAVYGARYHEKFIADVLRPLQQGEDIPWDRFHNIVPARTSEYHNASLIGTALPVYEAGQCVTCGMCVTSCPDYALRVTVIYDDDYNALPAASQRLFKSVNLNRFTGYGDASFKDSYLNINVVPSYCKGCGACVAVCKAGALKMIDKALITPDAQKQFLDEGIYDLDQSAKVLPYVKESKPLQQLMLGYSGQKFLPGGHSLCPGCGEGVIENLVFTAAEMVRKKPKIIEETYQSIPELMKKHHGKGLQHMVDHGFHLYTINATGCAQVSCLGNPYNARIYQSGHYGFGTASAAALGSRISLFSAFRNFYLEKLTKVLVFGGDGAFYDIGNQGLNFALGENQDVTWIIYNNEAYMNTGFQKSGASRYGSNRTTSPYGLELQGKEDFHREIAMQATVIPGVYVARLSLANPAYALKILKEAIAYKGPSLIEFFSPCPTGQGLAQDDMSMAVSRMMMESRAWTVFVRKPYAKIDISGNPDAEELFPRPKKIKGQEVPPATFRDIVELMGQFVGDKKTIDTIVKVNERQNLFMWSVLQFRAGLREKVLDADEVATLIANR
ncbi:MAG: 2-oxoacid:acceptor oxidoreductase family protein [Deltaproteobacteria bacterium]|nr:2-oxoacid:acceptor oxidoreductase family protein [Candidatus Anaeroferrophillus wilburensis]MBN2889896.1 2-oxoacid:acceptor oxidoreductase family protein [Deltaproteobacteria bacterium]